MNVLTKLEVFEISVVTVPANQNAVATEVKSVEPETKQGRRNRKADEEIIRNCIKSLESLLDDGDEDKPAEDEAKSAEIAVEVNEASEEPTPAENVKRAEELLAKIKEINGGSET
jgi:phage head maturation protease